MNKEITEDSEENKARGGQGQMPACLQQDRAFWYCTSQIGTVVSNRFFSFVLQGVRILFFCEEVFNHSLGGEASELVDISASCGQERSSNSAAL